MLLKLKSHLEKELPLRTMSLNEEERKLTSAYQFVSMKPMIIVLNVEEDKIKDMSLLNSANQKYKDLKITLMQVSAKNRS